VRRFKLSRDPAFAAKLRDVVGLYLDPPKHAIVLSVDEKSQIQALDRTQPGLPMKKGRAGTMTHDYIRHGTTTLFAALNVLEGTVIGQCMARHRHQEFIRFLNRVEAVVPAGKLIHAILDNYAAHKHPKVRAWLSRHPRWTFHFTPTSCSWANAVETFFATLTRVGRRGRGGPIVERRDINEVADRFLQSQLAAEAFHDPGGEMPGGGCLHMPRGDEQCLSSLGRAALDELLKAPLRLSVRLAGRRRQPGHRDLRGNGKAGLRPRRASGSVCTRIESKISRSRRC
jgi:hypothetical protein